MQPNYTFKVSGDSIKPPCDYGIPGMSLLYNSKCYKLNTQMVQIRGDDGYCKAPRMASFYHLRPTRGDELQPLHEELWVAEVVEVDNTHCLPYWVKHTTSVVPENPDTMTSLHNEHVCADESHLLPLP